MKALVPILIIIVVVGGIFYFKSSNEKNDSLKSETASLEIPGEQIPNEFQGTFVFDSAESEAKWTGSKKIIKDYFDSGTLDIKSGSISFENGEIKNGEIIFDMNSLNAVTTGRGDGQDGLTKHLKSEDFFEVETYPEAKFVVTSSEKNKDIHTLNGDLTLKGKTNPLSIDVKTGTENGNVTMVGIAEVDRSLWNVRFGSESFFDNLGDNVINDIFTLEFKIVARP